jgi:hypothetical protein
MSEGTHTCDRCDATHDYETQALKCCVVGGPAPSTDCARKQARRQRRAKSTRDAAKQREAWAGK